MSNMCTVTYVEPAALSLFLNSLEKFPLPLTLIMFLSILMLFTVVDENAVKYRIDSQEFVSSILPKYPVHYIINYEPFG